MADSPRKDRRRISVTVRLYTAAVIATLAVLGVLVSFYNQLVGQVCMTVAASLVGAGFSVFIFDDFVSTRRGDGNG